jgi:glycine cleavage system H protein
MAENPKNLKYTKEHEWVRQEGKVCVIGVTQHAQEALGDVVYVELPRVGDKVKSHQQFGVIESTKAVSELFSPLTGTVVKVNDSLTDEPTQVNTDPYGKGWIIEVEPEGGLPGDLMDAAGYEAHVATAK